MINIPPDVAIKAQILAQVLAGSHIIKENPELSQMLNSDAAKATLNIFDSSRATAITDLQ